MARTKASGIAKASRSPRKRKRSNQQGRKRSSTGSHSREEGNESDVDKAEVINILLGEDGESSRKERRVGQSNSLSDEHLKGSEEDEEDDIDINAFGGDRKMLNLAARIRQVDQKVMIPGDRERDLLTPHHNKRQRSLLRLPNKSYNTYRKQFNYQQALGEDQEGQKGDLRSCFEKLKNKVEAGEMDWLNQSKSDKISQNHSEIRNSHLKKTRLIEMREKEERRRESLEKTGESSSNVRVFDSSERFSTWSSNDPQNSIISNQSALVTSPDQDSQMSWEEDEGMGAHMESSNQPSASNPSATASKISAFEAIRQAVQASKHFQSSYGDSFSKETDRTAEQDETDQESFTNPSFSIRREPRSRDPISLSPSSELPSTFSPRATQDGFYPFQSISTLSMDEDTGEMNESVSLELGSMKAQRFETEDPFEQEREYLQENNNSFGFEDSTSNLSGEFFEEVDQGEVSKEVEEDIDGESMEQSLDFDDSVDLEASFSINKGTNGLPKFSYKPSRSSSPQPTLPENLDVSLKETDNTSNRRTLRDRSKITTKINNEYKPGEKRFSPRLSKKIEATVSTQDQGKGNMKAKVTNQQRTRSSSRNSKSTSKDSKLENKEELKGGEVSSQPLHSTPSARRRHLNISTAQTQASELSVHQSTGGEGSSASRRLEVSIESLSQVKRKGSESSCSLKLEVEDEDSDLTDLSELQNEASLKRETESDLSRSQSIDDGLANFLSGVNGVSPSPSSKQRAQSESETGPQKVNGSRENSRRRSSSLPVSLPI